MSNITIKQAGESDIPVIEGILLDTVNWLSDMGQPLWGTNEVTWSALSRNYQVNDFYIAYSGGAEFFDDFRKHDTQDDWTYGLGDDELREYICEDAIPSSRSMTDHLLKYGFTIYDTSAEREQVFNKIAEDIKLKLG